MLGIWKNYYDLEESISLPELTAILDAIREKTERDRKFAAALQGVDLSEDDLSATDEFEQMKQRVFGTNSEDSPASVVAPNGQVFTFDQELGQTVADDNFSWSSL